MRPLSGPGTGIAGRPALLAVFVWLSSPEVLGAVLLAALCHELGHYAVLRSRGGWVRHMEISALGANMQVAGRLSYGSELLAAAGGPAVNLLLAAALAALGRWWEPLYLLAVRGCWDASICCPFCRWTAGGCCGWPCAGGRNRFWPTGWPGG